MLHPVTFPGAGVADFLGGRLFAGACFLEGFSAMDRIVRRLIPVLSADVFANAFVSAVHLVRAHEVHLPCTDCLVSVA